MAINLLPPSNLAALDKLRRRTRLAILAVLTFVLLLADLLVLLAVNLWLQGEKAVVDTSYRIVSQQSQTARHQQASQKLAAINQAVDKVLSAFQKRQLVSTILDQLIQALPSGIYLYSFGYEQQSAQVSVTGFAPTREQLLTLREKLLGNPAFSQVDFPASNWVKAENINFFVNFQANQP